MHCIQLSEQISLAAVTGTRGSIGFNLAVSLICPTTIKS